MPKPATKNIKNKVWLVVNLPAISPKIKGKTIQEVVLA